MYVITRTYETKPGQARLAATLAAKICKAYEEAGQRDQPTVTFNGGTLPGEMNRVYMRWFADTPANTSSSLFSASTLSRSIRSRPCSAITIEIVFISHSNT